MPVDCASSTSLRTMFLFSADIWRIYARRRDADLLGEVPRERRLDRGVLKREPLAGQVNRHRALSSEKRFVGHLSEGEAKREGGRGEEGWAVEGAAERVREIAIANGSRCGDVVDAARGLVLDRPFDRAQRVVAIDPRHPLLAAADRTAHAELERQQHFLQRAAAAIEHDAEAQN